MRQQEFIHNYWMYYLNLETDFMNTLRYVELDERNYSTYSVEYAKQYQAVCSEIDVLCKKLCELIDSRSNVKNMREYTTSLLSEYPDTPSKEVKVKNRLTLKPWIEWQLEPVYISPTWWSDYNKVKHNRTGSDNEGDTYFMQANLGNVLKALTGLFVLEMYAYKKISEDENMEIKIPLPKSQFFELTNWESNVIVPDNINMIFTTE